MLGATGLVGSHIAELLTEEDACQSIRLIVRRPVESLHPMVEIRMINFEEYESLKSAIDGCKIVFCAIGTTQKRVKGDQSLYRKVDYEIPVNAARACFETAAQLSF